MDAAEPRHRAAAAAWSRLTSESADLVTTNYVVTEMVSLLQRRLGIKPLQRLTEALESNIAVHFVDRQLHDAALQACLAARRRHLGLVDCCSFAFMRRSGIERAFAIDRHFAEQGFELVPVQERDKR